MPSHLRQGNLVIWHAREEIVMGNRSRMSTLLYLLTIFLESFQAQQCPSEPTCYGCSSTLSTFRVTCAGGHLTAFPQLPESVQPRVDELILRSNSISEITAMDLHNYTSLETLDISFNNLSSIEENIFRNNEHLMELELHSNFLSRIPEHLFENTQLNILDLRDNLIENVTAETFIGLLNFSRVDLGNNCIQTLPSDVFSAIGILDELILRGNPLVCDCQLRWIPSFLANNATRPLFHDFGDCGGQVSNLTGVSIYSLTNEDDFECSCNPECVHGECNLALGECECESGYYGNYCENVPSTTRTTTALVSSESTVETPSPMLSPGVRTGTPSPMLSPDVRTETLSPMLYTSAIVESPSPTQSTGVRTKTPSPTLSAGIRTETPPSMLPTVKSLKLSTGAIAGIAAGGALIASIVLIVTLVLLVTLVCIMTQNSRSTRRVTQSLIQSNSEDTPSDTQEEEEGVTYKEGRIGFAYSDLESPPPPYEIVVGEKPDEVTAPAEMPEGEPGTLNVDSKCSFETPL